MGFILEVLKPLIHFEKYLLSEVDRIFIIGNHGANHAENAVVVAMVELVKHARFASLKVLNQVEVGRGIRILKEIGHWHICYLHDTLLM
ncbi:MAG: hypothetical protein OXT74_12790 [Candidatus Poribacteria bacterium]|nr:hypothetical protein [Candidatus Poribacteria bacterium]